MSYLHEPMYYFLFNILYGIMSDQIFSHCSHASHPITMYSYSYGKNYAVWWQNDYKFIKYIFSLVQNLLYMYVVQYVHVIRTSLIDVIYMWFIYSSVMTTWQICFQSLIHFSVWKRHTYEMQLHLKSKFTTKPVTKENSKSDFMFTVILMS
jgi:hypothetical protein